MESRFFLIEKIFLTKELFFFFFLLKVVSDALGMEKKQQTKIHFWFKQEISKKWIILIDFFLNPI